MTLKLLLATWCRRLADWFDPPAPAPEPVADLLTDTARSLMVQQDTIDGRSGEAKRHQVLAALQKDFPGVRERDIGFAIERIMQERG